jgi:hypothetical protein
MKTSDLKNTELREKVENKITQYAFSPKEEKQYLNKNIEMFSGSGNGVTTDYVYCNDNIAYSFGILRQEKDGKVYFKKFEGEEADKLYNVSKKQLKAQ